MGYAQHDAIVVTGWNPYIGEAMEIAREIMGGHLISQPYWSYSNGYITFVVLPDGGQDAFTVSRDYDAKRLTLVDRLNHFPVSWVHVSYGQLGRVCGHRYNYASEKEATMFRSPMDTILTREQQMILEQLIDVAVKYKAVAPKLNVRPIPVEAVDTIASRALDLFDLGITSESVAVDVVTKEKEKVLHKVVQFMEDTALTPESKDLIVRMRLLFHILEDHSE